MTKFQRVSVCVCCAWVVEAFLLVSSLCSCCDLVTNTTTCLALVLVLIVNGQPVVVGKFSRELAQWFGFLLFWFVRKVCF